MKMMMVLVVLSLAGCTVTYPVQGKFDDDSETMLGTVKANTLTAHTKILVSNATTKCEGNSKVTHVPAISYFVPICTGQYGTASLTCDDGRVIDATWDATSCTSGVGQGKDQNGAGFTFSFGDEAAYLAARKSK